MVDAKLKAEREEQKTKKGADAKHNRRIPEHKKKLVQDLAELMDKHQIIGLVNMENLPAKQLRNL